VIPFIITSSGVPLTPCMAALGHAPRTAAGGALLCLVIAMIIYQLWSPKALWTILSDSHAKSNRDDPVHHRRGRAVFLQMLVLALYTQSIRRDFPTGRQPLGGLMGIVKRGSLPVAASFLPPVGGDPDGGADCADHSWRLNSTPTGSL